MNDFYEKCAEILGVEYDGQPFTHYRRTRWNNRSPGSGRYPGYGIIRVFGDKIHVALQRPVSHHGIYGSQQEVLDLLRSIV